ncbi:MULTISPECIES: diguanylate cyclase domain-containing protein [unclassified Planococcus (in: firmicutes)]|uniref:diguanylate cyclase domain-containing protein n=1 Tax=unclassified Planococcus (in: firmicutes) TaxID=2662419 RepID=UPI003D6C2915
MTTQFKGLLGIFFMLFYTSFYFFWVRNWKDHETLLTLGGNILSVLGCFIAFVWLFRAFRKSCKEEKMFWLLLTTGTFSYFIAEFLWIVYENILGIEVPFPGPPDFFYMLQIVFYLGAFSYKLIKEVKKHQFTKYLLDVLIVMTVASTFSWHFLISPIIEAGDLSIYSFLVSLAYPVGDLALLLGIVSIYLGTQKSTFTKNLLFLSIGLFFQITADSAYLYLVSFEQYESGSIIDPLFILAILFIGFAGFLRTETVQQPRSSLTEQAAPQQLDAFRLSLPYINVLILFVFMGSRSTGIDVVTVGSGISILLVILRQILIILENQQLLRQYHCKTEELDVSEQRYKSLFDYHPDAVYSLDVTGRFESANPATIALFGYEKSELIGLSSTVFIDEEKQQRASEILASSLEGQPQSYELPIRSRLGKFHHLSITNIPIKVRNNIVGIFGIGKDITENKKNEEKIQFLAYHDPLTGLANRLYFGESLKKAVTEAEALNEIFAVMFIDLDHFKQINDTLGHDNGDELLISVANRLKSCVLENDIVSRLGGDEFTLIIRDVNDLEAIEQTAEKILQSLKQTHLINGFEIISLPSIGIAVYPSDATTTVDLMKKADKAMYQVKANGKGHFQFIKETI